MTHGEILSDTQRALGPVTKNGEGEKELMTNHAISPKRMLAIALLAASGFAPQPVAASEHHNDSDKAAADRQIHPVPGEKACLHHIAQYDEEGNFVGYKTERGPCK